MRAAAALASERVLILAPRGRDAAVAQDLLREARVAAKVCLDLPQLIDELTIGAELAILTEEAIRNADTRSLRALLAAQAAWSDFPFILLTQHGGGLERNPAAAELVQTLGNVTFLERPFHPTTLISVIQTGLRSRQRQYECRRLNEDQEMRVQERTAELAAANRQLLAQMEERERVEMTLRQMQRLEAIGQLTSGVAHDFNNLLTVVLGNVEVLEMGLAEAGVDGRLSRRLGYMRAAAERGAKLTDQLLAFSRRQRLEPKRLDLNEAVGSMRDLLQSTMGGSIRIETRLSSGVWPALVDPTQLELAILNLAINARDAMEVGGSLTVETTNVTLGEPRSAAEPTAGDYIAIRVADTGTGMPEEVQRKAFEPFFTTKEVGKGSGLGLSQVLGFAQQSGGGIGIESKPGDGTSVTIYLPRSFAAAETDAPATRVSVNRDFAGARILLVDDDNGVREVTATLLRDLGYDVLEAGSGGAALDRLEQESRVDLMLLDFAMPGMSGADLARRVQRNRPSLPMLFITGFAERTALAGVAEQHIINKPYRRDDLAQKIRGVLAETGTANVVRLREGRAAG